MPPVGFEPTIPVLEQVKAVHALGHQTNVMGMTHTHTQDNKLQVVKT
jgi:hypothetical protein